MSDEIVARKLRLIPIDAEIVAPVHFSEVFAKHEQAPSFEQIAAGLIAHEAADLIERQAARIAELEGIDRAYDELAEAVCGDKMIGPVAQAYSLKRDAERYRWLRDIENADSLNVPFMGSDLDGVIDAAIAGVKP